MASAGWRDGVGCAEHSLSLGGQGSALQSKAGVCRGTLGKRWGTDGKKLKNPQEVMRILLGQEIWGKQGPTL